MSMRIRKIQWKQVKKQNEKQLDRKKDNFTYRNKELHPNFSSKIAEQHVSSIF
jgi:hypothetical protein